MGDVGSLVQQRRKRLMKKSRPVGQTAHRFVRFNDFGAVRDDAADGPLENILGMLPGMSNVQGL